LPKKLKLRRQFFELLHNPVAPSVKENALNDKQFLGSCSAAIDTPIQFMSWFLQHLPADVVWFSGTKAALFFLCLT
jgi:hypothetical protein